LVYPLAAAWEKVGLRHWHLQRSCLLWKGNNPIPFIYSMMCIWAPCWRREMWTYRYTQQHSRGWGTQWTN
jgi:hypothetical protein